MFTYELTNLRELREKFDPKLVDKAFQRALQVAATKARTRISRKVRQTYNIKAGEISRSVVLRKLQSEPGRLLIYTGRMIGLDKFGARSKKVTSAKGPRRGVTVLLKKGGGRKLVKGAFLGQAANAGHPFVFKRKRGTRMIKNPKKEQLRRLYGPSIAHMAGNKSVFAEFEAHAGEDAAIEFNRFLEFLMTSASPV